MGRSPMVLFNLMSREPPSPIEKPTHDVESRTPPAGGVVFNGGKKTLAAVRTPPSKTCSDGTTECERGTNEKRGPNKNVNHVLSMCRSEMFPLWKAPNSATAPMWSVKLYATEPVPPFALNAGMVKTMTCPLRGSVRDLTPVEFIRT